MSNLLLNVNGIEVIYNHVILVLKGVSLQVPEGGVVALLGGNGAGKTTTLRAVSNLLAGERGEVTKGSIELRGERIEKLSPAQMVERGVSGLGVLPVLYGAGALGIPPWATTIFRCSRSPSTSPGAPTRRSCSGTARRSPTTSVSSTSRSRRACPSGPDAARSVMGSHHDHHDDF